MLPRVIAAGVPAAAAGFLACAAPAQDIEVLYTEVPGHPTAVVPGAVDAGGPR